MSHIMTPKNFRWMLEDEFKNIDWMKQIEAQPIGYLVECDLKMGETRRITAHYLNLPFYLEHGARLVKVVRVLCYEQVRRQQEPVHVPRGSGTRLRGEV